MVQEFEHLRNELLRNGKPKIAREVNAVLKKYQAELPPTFPPVVSEEDRQPSLSTFLHEGQLLPITQEVLENPQYTGEILGRILPFGLSEGRSPRIVTQAYNALARHFLTRDDSNPTKDIWKTSLFELMMLSDKELLGSGRAFGDTSLEVFRRSTQRMIEAITQN